ncbi:hypothetical protein KUTeg_024039 [Tegillarca granosa]|uniref:Uncharacterized protein n=1 Tax=Tegillarca granosa TaxID=220873 RepID=A0ABQ9E2K1_TEGGR|nr:hypothetical protein KUTeg_024039 [Tegillarca granosa]
MAEFIGRHVKLCLNDGKEVEGYVHSVDQSTGKLTLEREAILNCATKKRIPGFRCYFGSEIATIDVLEDVKKKKEIVKEDDLLKPEKREAGPRILHQKQIPPHLRKIRDIEALQQSSSLYRRSQSDDEITDRKSNNSGKSSDNDSGEGTSDLDLSESSTDQPYVLLNKTNREFDQAIMDIKKESVIGVAMEGVCIGRKGKLCWLQVADVFVYRLHMGKGDWPRYVKGLAAALLDHLGLSEDQIYSLAIRQNFKKEDQEVWAQRPVRRQMLELAMKNVMYLRELRIVLMEKMLAEFVAGVDLYLTQSQQHLLPIAFNELPALMTDRNNYRWQRRSRNMTRLTDPQGFVENFEAIKDCHYARDTTWNSTSGNTVTPVY